MKEKKHYFDFYVCQTNTANQKCSPKTSQDIFQIFSDRFANNDYSVKKISGIEYDMRFLEPTTYGFRGTVAKHRDYDLPHAAKPGGAERELSLEPQENLIDKSSFAFYSEHSLLILQRNFYGIGPATFGRYLTESAYVTVLNPVIQPSDLKLLMSDKTQVRNLEVTVARPTNPELFKELEHDFNNTIFKSLNGTSSAVVHMNLRGDARSKTSKARYIAKELKSALLETQRIFDLSKCRMLLEEEDTKITHPIDLIADRLCFSKLIQSFGRYPPQNEIWQALAEARQSKAAELEIYFGTETQLG